MHCAQRVIELSLRHLYALYDEALNEAGTVEKAWNRIRQQRAGLPHLLTAGLSPQLLERIDAAIATRNTLAHDYFVHPVRASILGDGRARARLLADLRDAERRYAQLEDELAAIAEDRARELGITSEDEAEAERVALGVLAEMRAGDD